MRRLAFLVLAAALLSASSASAALRPLAHGHGELGQSLVRAGTIRIPPAHTRGRVRVIVRLPLPPLAAVPGRRSLASTGRARLSLRSSAARAHLRRLAAAQHTAAVALRRAIPGARVERRYRIVLNGLAVSVPATSLPRLVRLPFATRVYPNLGYTVATNESPALVGAPALAAATGARGDGIKIAIVDDGVDPRNRYFAAAGYAYPPGFPKGARTWTTPKVVVARVFPGRGAGRRGRLALDRRASFHGTHVAGIAAGNAGTSAPRGPDHPAVRGLSGVAPRAYLGNYRVFTVPTPIGHVANTPEIVAAFEAAVRDGMDVVNFSGGGPQVDPVNDALLEAVANVARAGVVPVISAGNDREDFGLGSAGSPGIAPAAISVAAATNTHVFAPALQLTAADAPESLRQLPFQPGAGGTPAGWARSNRSLVDVASLVGRDGSPVDTRLCGAGENPNGGPNPLPPRSLRGAIALVSRGDCTFASKAERVRLAGGVGMVLVDNRPGEANAVPVLVDVPTGTIADADGARLRTYLAQRGGRTTVRIGRRPLQHPTGRGGVVAPYSAAGPTAFGHALKPDVVAPGTAILSSTLREFAGSPFAVFDGTSMAAPHVSGAAALLLQLHPGWTPEQVKSALVSTAGPAWADTARTSEAPVTVQGGGLVNVVEAATPHLFTAPSSLSFGDLDVSRGAEQRALLLTVSDAGDGAGTWQVQLRPQAATAGATLEVAPFVTLAPGASTLVHVVARAEAGAEATEGGGLNHGFLVLRRGDVVRRIPYLFLVERPRLAVAEARRLRRLQAGSTRAGASRTSVYGFPSAPFGPDPGYTGPSMVEGGAEKLYVRHLTRPVANVGVAVTSFRPGDALIHPWFLGAKDENEVQGFAGTPVNVNAYTLDHGIDLGAAGANFPRQQRFFVAVDSGRDPFTDEQLPGRYVLRSWVNDVTPPRVQLLTRRVVVGRPLVAARVRDRGSGVDPHSLYLGYRRILLSAAAYDPASGLAVFVLPDGVPALRGGRTRAVVVGADFQEAKNISTPGDAVLPNTAFRAVSIRATRRPVVTWLAPRRGACVRGAVRLLVAAGSTRRVRRVRFLDGDRPIRTVRHGARGLYGTTWRAGRRRGRHVLRAVARDASGRTFAAKRNVRVCR